VIGALIIGDEILRGKREDKHLARLIGLLGARGLRLDWAEYLGDNPELITATLRRTFASGDIVFSFGGIGATPDDHTRACAAAAAGVDLVLHPEAEAEMRARFGAEINAFRLKMGEFPRGSAIIPNPYNRIPGFSVGDHHFVPGFPIMAWPMVEWVLDQRYANLFHARGRRGLDHRLRSHGKHHHAAHERYRGALPRREDLQPAEHRRRRERRHIELGVRGTSELVSAAIADMRTGVVALGGKWEAQD